MLCYQLAISSKPLNVLQGMSFRLICLLACLWSIIFVPKPYSVWTHTNTKIRNPFSFDLELGKNWLQRQGRGRSLHWHLTGEWQVGRWAECSVGRVLAKQVQRPEFGSPGPFEGGMGLTACLYSQHAQEAQTQDPWAQGLANSGSKDPNPYEVASHWEGCGDLVSTVMLTHTHTTHVCLYTLWTCMNTNTTDKNEGDGVDIPSAFMVGWRVFHRIKNRVKAETKYSPSFLPFFPLFWAPNTCNKMGQMLMGTFPSNLKDISCCHLPYIILCIAYRPQSNTASSDLYFKKLYTHQNDCFWSSVLPKGNRQTSNNVLYSLGL